MPQPFTHWKVLPHGKLTKIDDNILTVIGTIPMPVGKMTRRMTVVRLRDGRLVIFSAIALNDHEMTIVEDFGKPSFLIVPNAHHRLDAKPWKDRYPSIQVIAPQGALKKIEGAVTVDSTHADFGDPGVVLVTVSGTGGREFALQVSGPSGTTLVLNDVVANISDPSGFGGWLLRLMGFAGDKPHVPIPIKWVLIKDQAAFAAQLRIWTELPALKQILVSHGSSITDEPSRILRELAASIDQQPPPFWQASSSN
jgi:hypothetical protein